MKWSEVVIGMKVRFTKETERIGWNPSLKAGTVGIITAKNGRHRDIFVSIKGRDGDWWTPYYWEVA